MLAMAVPCLKIWAFVFLYVATVTFQAMSSP